MIAAAPSAQDKREIRVFLSSTFKDMDAERTHLLKEVFPRIRAKCAERNVGFTEIDLRWGVDEEQAKNGETVEICLAEIDRCREFPPFFIGFLGERYGWVPSQNDLQCYWQQRQGSPYADKIRQALEQGISVTELEMNAAVLKQNAAERLKGQVLFLLRAPELTQELAQRKDNPDFYDSTHQDKLDQLKARIRAKGKSVTDGTDVENACAQEQLDYDYLVKDGYRSIQEFGALIEAFLMAMLNRLYPQVQAPDARTRLRNAHATFRAQRLQRFIPRPAVRRALIEALHARCDRRVEGR